MGSEELQYVLGASGAISGLMAMSLIWAPKNEVQLVGFYILIFVIRPFSWDVTILGMATFYIFLDFFFAWLQGFQLSTQLIHSLGAGLGFSIGLLLLKYDLVDCENWDVFSVWAGHPGNRRKRRRPNEESSLGICSPPELAHLGKAPSRKGMEREMGTERSARRRSARSSRSASPTKSRWRRWASTTNS